jgi:hypothetical protein
VALAPPAELARVALELLEAPGRRKELGERAARLYRERFALERLVARLRSEG